MILQESTPNIKVEKLQLLEKQLNILQNKSKKSKITDNDLSNINSNMSSIFGFNISIEIIYSGHDSYNCSVVTYPDYDKIKSLKSIGELTDTDINLLNVKVMIFSIGIKLIEKLTTKELVAVLLHEFGHWHYNYKTSIPFIRKIMDGIRSFSYKTAALAPILGNIIPFVFPLLALIFITSTAVSMLRHKVEYGCDEIAIKYGYGDDLYSTFDKISKITKQTKNPINTKNTLDIILKHLFVSTHPSLEDRMKRIISSLENEYSKLYTSNKHKALIKSYYEKGSS